MPQFEFMRLGIKILANGGREFVLRPLQLIFCNTRYWSLLDLDVEDKSRQVQCVAPVLSPVNSARLVEHWSFEEC